MNSTLDDTQKVSIWRTKLNSLKIPKRRLHPDNQKEGFGWILVWALLALFFPFALKLLREYWQKQDRESLLKGELEKRVFIY